MAEVHDREGLLAHLEGFGAVERMLLASAGTLQSTLTALFQTPVDVQVIDQETTGGVLRRRVSLVRGDRGTTVCEATSTIEVADPRVRELLTGERLGIGAIIAELGLRATFELIDTGRGPHGFHRVYELVSEGFRCRIEERFPADLVRTAPP